MRPWILLVLVGGCSLPPHLGRIAVARRGDETFVLAQEGRRAPENVGGDRLWLAYGRPGAWSRASTPALRGYQDALAFARYRLLVPAAGSPTIVLGGRDGSAEVVRVVRLDGDRLVDALPARLDGALCEAWLGADDHVRVLLADRLLELADGAIVRERPLAEPLPCGDDESWYVATDDDHVTGVSATRGDVEVACAADACTVTRSTTTVPTGDDGCSPCVERAVAVRLPDGTPALVTLRARDGRVYTPVVAGRFGQTQLAVDDVFALGATATADGLAVVTVSYGDVVALHRLRWDGAAVTAAGSSLVRRGVDAGTVEDRLPLVAAPGGALVTAWESGEQDVTLATIAPDGAVTVEHVPLTP